MADSQGTSSASLNRLSVYLRCLHELLEEGFETVSSKDFADRFHLTSAQIRKDLAQFGGFGIRGVGYEIAGLAERLHRLLGLDTKHRLVIVGMGNLGSALAGYVGFNDNSFEVVAGFDVNPSKIGHTLGGLTVRHVRELGAVVEQSGIEIGVLTVPAAAAVESYEALVSAGIRSVLNFAPVHLTKREGVELKNVDLRIHLEEASFLLQSLPTTLEEAD
jgi:redox-sensing transcriptional repressor